VQALSQDTASLLHEATAGALRDLDRIAATCLRRAALEKRKIIDRGMLGAVLRNAAR
jgi:hypothetical protein